MPRVLAVLACAALLVPAPARADDPRPLTPRAHRLKIAGSVLLSIAGTASLVAIGSFGASAYYNSDNHWQGHDDTGVALGVMGGSIMAAAGILTGIAAPLACANERQGALAVRVSPFGVSGTF